MDDLPLFHGLDPGDQERLRALATLFLHEKELVTLRDLELDDAEAVALAAIACLPVLNLGIDAYSGWRTVVLYPGGFLARHRYTDEDGLAHDEESELAGEAWEGGPVVLSWDDVEASLALDGFNVVLHEFAHKLDMRNGDANGYPPLHADMDRAAWTSAMQGAFEALGAAVEAGEPMPLDPYAAEAPAEFFAVASEAFFECPGLLREALPAVYEQLAGYYRQDPAARLPPA